MRCGSGIQRKKCDFGYDIQPRMKHGLNHGYARLSRPCLSVFDPCSIRGSIPSPQNKDSVRDTPTPAGLKNLPHVQARIPSMGLPMITLCGRPPRVVDLRFGGDSQQMVQRGHKVGRVMGIRDRMRGGTVRSARKPCPPEFPPPARTSEYTQGQWSRPGRPIDLGRPPELGIDDNECFRQQPPVRRGRARAR